MAIKLLGGTGAANSNEYGAHSADTLPATFIAPSLGVGETITLQISYDEGQNWINLVQGGTTVQLTETNVAEAIHSPGIYRGVRSAGSSPLYVASSRNP